MTFVEKYERAAKRNASLLCVGLDPNPDLMPEGVERDEFLLEIIAKTSDLVCCYKPNSPFFEVDGARTFEMLKTVMDAIPPEIPTVLDSKRADIANTSEFFARSGFEHFGAGAMVVNPYMGGDALEPFIDFEDRHTFVLCRTSNRGAADLQDLLAARPGSRPEEAQPLYEHVALMAQRLNRRHGNVGLVVGATYPREAAEIRKLCPEMLFLVPGVGAQEAELQAAVCASADESGGRILVNASRSVLYAGRGKPDYGENFADYAREAAELLRTRINEALHGQNSKTQHPVAVRKAQSA